MNIEYVKAEEADRRYFEELSETCYRQIVETLFGDWDDLTEREKFASKWDQNEFEKVYVDGELVGGVWLEEHDQYFQLREVQLQPGFRNRGIGTEVISRCISMAKEARKPIRLRVLRTSPAVKLYARLGFELYGEKKSSKQFLMELRP